MVKPATGASITHVYTSAGLFTVRLIITDIAGCRDTLTKIQYIRINGPTAAFTIPNGGSCFNSVVTFIDNSTDDGFNPIITWIWNYGDGTGDTVSAPPFTHFYAAAGSYNVTLKTIDAIGCVDSTSNTQTIVISNPVAGYTQSDTIVCPFINVQFTNTSTGPNLTYLWNFGDGNTSTGASPVHSYTTEGVYIIRLRITDQYGCEDSTATSIQVAPPHASFTVSDTLSTCPPLIANFTNTSVNGYAATWDFGDGSTSNAASPVHIYNNPGTYIAKLFVTGPGNNCFDTVMQQIVVRGPVGTFSYGPLTGCSPLTVNFTGVTLDNPTFIWDFNDGTIINTARLGSELYLYITRCLPAKNDPGRSGRLPGTDRRAGYHKCVRS